MMKQLYYVAIREMKMGFRNPWAYTFMGLFSLFMLTLLLIHSQGYVKGYSGVTGTMLNLILYLLPLMTLMLGSFSLTGEKEDRSWELLSTYPISTTVFMIGKYCGLSFILLSIIGMGFGVAGAIGAVTARGFSFGTYGLMLCFSVSLALMYLAISMLIGTIAKNRWQALTIAVAIWFFTIIAWPSFLIASLGVLPYMWIKPSVSMLTLLNPAELSRLFSVVKLGGGAMLGAEYYDWVKWIRQPSGTFGFIGACLIWITAAVSSANWLWEKGRGRV